MNKEYPLVYLSELLAKSENYIDIDPLQRYKQVTVKLWGKGVELRSEVEGASISAPRMTLASKTQFILSKIDARNGAFGLIPEALDGAVVSSDFPVFAINTSKIVPEYLN